ncbi:uncharacterized protein LOC107882894 isoform X1 [Acyrthosiphon pisum]|uniref:DUF4806 domain-containing protein n=1 Tax=Acyrthosiphon pisum TaxID=7029 RepID=A0A8R2D217_ACYPI|nr:uncharacterized protein LOC107882894 isoform X1 [Acyrthosiphon pisum]XP_029346833.1 uncharacterized protein LOC107882894 isoform X1 [Acyrthosiphon pisum]|eukprot:XP_016657479.1 PREDICTED: uncharacterized protein LOC107882894 [Acyrthosiphon pisum]
MFRCDTPTRVDNLKISRKKKDSELITAGHFRKIINLEKKKHPLPRTSFNQLQPNYNICDPSPIINVTTIASNSSSVLPNYHFVEYPLNDILTTQNNTPFNVSNISSDNPIGQNVQPYNIDGIDLKDKIRSWILHHKVSHNCVNSILKIMKSEGLQVPSDVPTLMKTPLSHEIFNIDNGSYIHFGLEKMLTPILKKYFNKIDFNNVLKIGINIDGLPISKCSKNQLWPILLSIINCNELSDFVIPIGIFQGLTKPSSVTEFFHPFLLDISALLESGLCVNDKIFKFEISHIVCDFPAKAFLLNVKGHNGYFGCSSCTQEGRYLQNRMTFPDIDAPLRSNESFRNRVNEDYHKGDSPLELLPINIVDSVCLDYMHNNYMPWNH